ncbi:cobyrinate a,c-diamide synthase [Denitromonas iodatirespirans]|uniref:Cobyrinate a,c-diamide synthase n=1 Tax=Denitromonas iodatirespirans TaxID=2795389 RepID=A0A944DDP5_DENI1|nr:cobyrinate a,c-diamide synthase [Denitromonas iodatirespirans]MBT0962578.1 cobyrinate a,c-diamide synthase [Denitromonas iodatirespirans]
MTPANSPAASHRCPALLISAPASGQGKTTATAALARWHTRQGRRVRVFKTGPDFLDPTILAQASGHPVYQLDLWMGGEAHCRALLHAAAADADLILVEGVMGLHDGIASSAALAETLGLPVLAVIDAAAMAQTFGAIALGLASYRPGLNFYGVLANGVGSPGHAQMLRESLPADMAWLGALPRNAEAALPSRHLGLLQADEITDLTQRIDRAADALDAVNPPLPAPVDFSAPRSEPIPRRLDGVTIAVARDAAFAFLYPANLDTLRALGAELRFFSPLAEPSLPRADALYLPGGYPELHLHALAGNDGLRQALHAHHRAGKPIVAECGGMLALLDTLTDHDGHCAALFGLLPGEAAMAGSLVNLGMHSVLTAEGEVRGHTFHHARVQCQREPAAHSIAQRHSGTPEAIWRDGRLFASFMHLYFPSNPTATAALFLP